MGTNHRRQAQQRDNARPHLGPILEPHQAGIRIDQLLVRSIDEGHGFRLELVHGERSGRASFLDPELLRPCCVPKVAISMTSPM
jgi:hypothetical protein